MSGPIERRPPAAGTRDHLNHARRAYQEAGDALQAATSAAYPIGCVVAVTLGKSRVIGEVIASGHWSSWDRAKVSIRNLRTGKTRHFSANSDQYGAVVLQPTNHPSIA